MGHRRARSGATFPATPLHPDASLGHSSRPRQGPGAGPALPSHMESCLCLPWLMGVSPCARDDGLCPDATACPRPCCRNLPDVTAQDFEQVDLSQYKWIHWEVNKAAGPPCPGGDLGRGWGYPVAPGHLDLCPLGRQGRNAAEQVKMIQRVEEHNRGCAPHQRIATSVEVEKPREELYQLLGYGDVVGADAWGPVRK